MRFSIITAALFVLTGCASIGGGGQSDPFSDLKQFVREDVGSALARAQKATDAGAPYRARCYVTMLKYISEQPVAGEASTPTVGLIDAFEVAAEKIAEVRASGIINVPEEFQANCGYIIDEVKRFALRNAAKALPGGGFGGLLLR